MVVRGVVLVLGCVTFGCNRGLDSIEGYDFGHPKSAVWATDETDRVMVIASDSDRLCTDLADPEAKPGIWTMSVWSTGPAAYESDLGAEALASIRDGVLDDDFAGDGDIVIDDHDGSLDVWLDLTFGSDRVRGRFLAEACDEDLFRQD